MYEQSVLKFREVADFIPTNHGDSITIKRPVQGYENYKDPEGLYLIYITQTPNFELDIRHMYDYRIASIEQAEIDLLRLARGPLPTPTYVGKNFIDLKWLHSCYVTLVLDLPRWEFQWAVNAGEPDAITFHPTKDGIGTYDPNYSFYNAKKVRIPFYDSDGNWQGDRAAVRCTNYIKKNQQGDDLKYSDNPNVRNYTMDINVLQPLAGGGGYKLLKIDPDGQNQGPPGVP